MFFHCHTLHNWPTDVVTGLSFGGGPDNQPIHFEAPTCDGSESRLVDCTFDADDDCAKPEDVGIICQRSEGWFQQPCMPICNTGINNESNKLHNPRH